jgi:hypothetical protein
MGQATPAKGYQGGIWRVVELASEAAGAEGASCPAMKVTGDWPSRPPPGTHPAGREVEEFRPCMR